MDRKLLIISHNAYLGAPSLLLDECRYLNQKGWELRFIFFQGGCLLHKFSELGEICLLRKVPKTKSLKTAAACFLNWIIIKKILFGWSPDLIYANATPTAIILSSLSFLKVATLMHVHELEYQLGDLKAGEPLLAFPTHYIAVSNAVRDCLIRYGVKPEKISVIHGAIDTQRIGILANHNEEKNLGAGSDFVIGGAGNVNPRKGVDLWLHAAAQIKTLTHPQRVKFVWIGKLPDNPKELFRLKFEIQRLGLSDDVKMLGLQDNPYPIYSQLDLFLLSSREDAFPLVVLENMFLEKAIVCFQQSGGAPEVVTSDTGIVVKSLDVKAMAEASVSLLRNKERRLSMGALARDRILNAHTIEHMGDKIHSLLQSFLHGKS